MNTMLKGFGGNNGSGNILSQIRQFADNLKKSGKDPNQLLNELMASGKYTQEQIEQAKRLAQMFSGKL